MTEQSFLLPDDLRYDAHHQWARREGDVWRCGITAYQADSAGDMVSMGLPDVGAEVQRDQEVGSVESGKWVSSLYAPVSGTVVEVNRALVDDPALVNRSPYDQGWIFAVRSQDERPGLSLEEYLEVIRAEQDEDAPRIRERAR